MKIFLYIMPVAILVAYSQIMVKWRTQLSVDGFVAKTGFEKYLDYFSDPYILSAYVAALMSSFIWLLVIQRIPLSTGFPIYIGSTFLIVILGSWFLLGETLSPLRVLAAGLILIGIVLASLS